MTAPQINPPRRNPGGKTPKNANRQLAVLIDAVRDEGKADARAIKRTEAFIRNWRNRHRAVDGVGAIKLPYAALGDLVDHLIKLETAAARKGKSNAG